MSDTWVRAIVGGREHRNGVAWYDAPIPRRWHRCKEQSRYGYDELVRARCACGGYRWGGERRWLQRNSRSRL